MSEKDHVVLPKKAIQAIYESLIKNEDKIREMVKSLNKLGLAVKKLANNQAEVIPWVQDLEERLALSLDVVNGTIDQEEYDSLLAKFDDLNLLSSKVEDKSSKKKHLLVKSSKHR